MFALRQANLQAILQFAFAIPRQLLLVVYNHACGGCSSGNVLQLQKKHTQKKNHTTSGWVSGRPHHCPSRFSGKSQGSYKRATTAGGKLSVRDTMVCSTQPPSSQPIGMKAVAHGLGLLTHVRTQRQNLQQTDYNVRRWGSDGLPKLVHKCIPDRIFNELK